MMSPRFARPTRDRSRPLIVAGAVALALLLPACSKPAKETETAAAPKPAAPAPKPEAPAPKPAAPPQTVSFPVAKDATAGPELNTVDQRVSYGVGYNVGRSIARQADLAVDRAALQAGIEDGVAAAKTRIPEDQIEGAFVEMQKRAAEKQLEVAQTFFDKNRTRPGVVVTNSGLQYEVLEHGNGLAKPTLHSTVTVNYEGRLLDGTVFDSSIKRGVPAQFTVGGVIRGWTEALQLMSVGDKWRLYIPASLAYGARGNGRIPPNAALIFDVQLLAIK